MTQAPDSPDFVEFEYTSASERYFCRLADEPQLTWLDSGKPHSESGRFDIISCCAREVLVNPSKRALEQSIAKLSQGTKLPSELISNSPFWGGAIGYFAYHHRHGNLEIPTSIAQSSVDSVFNIFDWALIVDHQKQRCFAFFLSCCDPCTRDSVLAHLSAEDFKPSLGYRTGQWQPDTPKAQYLEKFDEIKSHIAAGNVYQINFTQRFSTTFQGSAMGAYLDARRATPHPYSAYLDIDLSCKAAKGDAENNLVNARHPQKNILCLSPEGFISIRDGHATTQPIKGTEARRLDKTEDMQAAKELKNSAKNRAENIMIVDLLRNDFSQSCTPNSVITTRLCELQTFANVHHLVSEIHGDIKENISALEFIFRCFPGGSITGAPKRRAMEIIAELEHKARDVYCGSIGYLSLHGQSEFNIAIRTMCINHNNNAGEILCWGGGGIVADSAAEQEYLESITKVQSLMDAVARRPSD